MHVKFEVCSFNHFGAISISDSLSSLLAIHNRHLETGYVQKFLVAYGQLVNFGKTITLCWIPSHIGIRGNERADVNFIKDIGFYNRV